MITDHQMFSERLPPGYVELAEEPEFDMDADISLEIPANCLTLPELGYKPDVCDLYPSSLAITKPFRLLSDTGIEKLRAVIRDLKKYAIWSGNSSGPGMVRGAAYRSRFIRNLCLCTGVIEALSEMAKTSLTATAFGHQIGHINLAPRVGGPTGNWHIDQNVFVVVLCLYDPDEIDGGAFEYYRGTRASGFQQLAKDGHITSVEVEKIAFPGPGYAVLMQGSTVVHRGGPLTSSCERITMVTSYEPRDVRFPDANPTQLIADSYGDDPNGVIERSVRSVELARHKARRVRAHLDDFIREVPWTASDGQIIEALASSVREIVEVAAALKEGNVSPTTALTEYVRRLGG